jgi:hypothetical protein
VFLDQFHYLLQRILTILNSMGFYKILHCLYFEDFMNNLKCHLSVAGKKSVIFYPNIVLANLSKRATTLN